MTRNPIARAAAMACYYGLAQFLPRRTRFGGTFGAWLRGVCARTLFARSAAPMNIEPRVDFGSGRHIQMGRGSSIGWNSQVRGLVADEYVMIGPELLTITSNHVFTDPTKPVFSQGTTDMQIPSVGYGSWLGARVTLLPGVHVGRFCVIGACSVVTKDIPDYAVAAGNPARVIRFWNEDATATSGVS